METGKTALGALLALAAGVVIGILFAPDKGSKTRKKIIDKGKSVVNDVKDKANEFSQSITDKYGSIVKEVKDISDKN
ncbi:MAG TPA: YtxH domain-containing protein [Flavobacterium sp.]|nr:YtxH domain-containing protein [Flavobacterium sp.]